MLRWYARWYGTQSPLVMVAWMSVLNLGVVAVACYQVFAQDNPEGAVILLGVWAAVFLTFGLASFALVRHYDVDYYRGSLIDYLRERRNRRGGQDPTDQAR